VPWPPKQRAAIAADLRRKGKGREQISAFFRAHGHGSHPLVKAARRSRKKR